jgi:hypothetical protein
LGRVGSRSVSLLGVILAVYLTTAVHHLFVLMFVRERRGLQATFLVVGYEPPVSLIGWVPVLGYLVGRYVLYITARHRLKGAA